MFQIKHLLIGLLLFCIPVSANEQKPKQKFKYKLSAVAIFQNEAKYFREWIEYHKMIGVEHFYLYNNRSDDDFLFVLAPYVVNKEVEIIDWPAQAPNGWWGQAQVDCYTDAVKRSKNKTQWLAVLDVDEFIVPVGEDNLVKFLSNYTNYGGVVANWILFGTSHVWEIPKKKLLIETLLLRAPINHGENCHVKSIVQPRYVFNFPDAHHANYIEGYFQVTADFERFDGAIMPKVLPDKIRINHYWTRDEKFLEEVKVERRKRWGEGVEDIYIRAKILNGEPDDIILRFVPKLRKKMGFKS